MLYHFSEDPQIKIFKPRRSEAFPHLNPVVWAIDEGHAPHYYFPRNCPRVIYWKNEETTKDDKERFFPNKKVDKVVVVENGWLEKIRNTVLYVYSFPDKPFEYFEEAKTAGYYISQHTVRPAKVEVIDDLMGKLLRENIELRFTPNLQLIRNAVISSTLDFSIIRFSHAQPSSVKIN